MLNTNICLSITWDKNYFVYGVVLSKSGRKFRILDFALSEDKESKFVNRISEVYKKLDGDNRERVVIGGYVENILIFTIDTPSLKITEIKKFLEFEIIRYIPGNIEDYSWTYRPLIYTVEEKNKIKKVKVVAILKSVFDQGANYMIEAGIKFDAFLHPFYVIDPLYTAFDLYLETIDEKFYSCASMEDEGCFIASMPEDEQSRLSILEETDIAFNRFEPALKENLKYYIPAIIIGEYALSPGFEFEKNRLYGVSPFCKPKRFKHLKILSLLLVIITFFLFSSYIAREYYYNSILINGLEQQSISLKASIQKTKSTLIKIKKTDDYIQLVDTLIPACIDLYSFLKYFVGVTPKYIWANNLDVSETSITVSMQANGDTEKFLSDLYKSQDYTLQNSKKNKTSDTEFLYLTFGEKKLPKIESYNQ